jgi:hypothetical protein
MAFFSDDIIGKVEAVARIRYMARDDVKLWNENRRGGELRLLSGWCWTAKKGSEYRQGLKTYSAAVRDAYYELVLHEAAPGITPRRTSLKAVA